MKNITEELMFNVINGLRLDSKMGQKHLKKYPEDRGEIRSKYEEFIKVTKSHEVLQESGVRDFINKKL